MMITKLRTIKMPRIKKEKMKKLPEKLCFLCGQETKEYIIFKNGAVCENCQNKESYRRLLNEK